MSKLLWNILKFSPVVVAATLSAAGSALAGEVNGGMTSVNQLAQGQQSENIGQVTSVSQFSDVQPTDWAFQALQSLVERYGCIAGYPNGTYRGNRALTRYEFAAGLNACLDRVNELIATATADLVTKEDLAALQRLQEEFSAELATLRGRVDNLEARTAELEANQFSTTTKLVGEAVFSVSDAFGDQRANSSSTLVNNPNAARRDLDSNTVFSERVRLSLNSSFTGKDQLQIRLQAGNTTPNNVVTGTNMTRLAYDNDTGNDVFIDKINYAFNLTDAVRIKVDANNGEFWENIPNFNPDFASSSTGSISRYGRFSPIYRQGSGGAGATISFAPKGSPLSLSAGYLAGGSNNTASSPLDRNGLFDGNYAAIAQLGFQPSKQLGIGFTYANTYQNATTTVAGVTSGGGVNSFGSTGSNLASTPFGNVPTSGNHYGVQANFKASDRLAVGGWFGYADLEAESGGAGVAGKDATATYWAANLGLRDFGSKGSLLGITFGQPPKITGSRYRVAGVRQKDQDTSYQLETLYRLQLNDNISVTPSLLVIFNPEHNDNNDTIYIGTLRTTFRF
ncbi:S-layer region-like protein [Calothrix sp. NIES-4101]|nr:S-layer region-like protein [Calothrix sp. NIES-4101]